MSDEERELLYDRAHRWMIRSREAAGMSDPYFRGMAAAYAICSASIARILGESTVTPLEDAIDPDEAHKDAIRATVIESIAADSLHGRAIEDL